MKHNKGILILCLFICALFTISSVCASDLNEIDADDDLESIDEIQTIEENNNEEIVQDVGMGTFQDFQDMIDNAPENSTLILDRDYINTDEFYESTHGMGIKFNKSLTIDGQGHTLNGDGKGRILYNHIFTGQTLYTINLKNINFINANNSKQGNGGAIDMSSWINSSIINCTFINNTCYDGGGAIYGSNCAGTIISNCIFENNTSTRDNGGAGAISFYRCNSVISDCNFTNNSVLGEAGAISWSYSDNATILNCNFINNSAGVHGGAVEFWSSGNSTVSNCTFINNSAGTTYGGALYWFGYGGRLTDCSFEDNHGVNGGAVWFDSANVVNNCNFTNNIADEAGGAVNWRRGAPNITDCLFEKNSAPKGGALYLNKSSEDSFISNCDFINNTADVGGAIYNNNSTDGIVSGCNFIENSALNGDGGAIYMYFAGTTSPYWSYKDGTAINCNFIKNSAENGNGGAIYWSLSEEGSISGCDFEENTAKNGGALYWEGTNCTLDDCYFIGNIANGDGGAIYSSGDTGNFSNSEFIMNSASGNGGAVFNGTVVNCDFEDNTAMAGSSIYEGIADSCIFYGVTPSDVEILQPTFSVNNLVYTYKAPKKLTFNLISANGMAMNNRDVFVEIYYKNGTLFDTYYCSSDGLLVDLPIGSYYALCKVMEFNLAPVNATITVNKIPTTITASAVTAVYNTKKYLVITLKDAQGNLLSNASVSVKLKTLKTYKTNANGQIKILVGKLVPKKYTAVITFNGDSTHQKSTKNVTVKVTKAKSAITAKKKTFKKALKVKKYSIKLKSGKTLIKKARVYLKVKGKTYKATTNSKGKATFKIKNLKKRGTFTAKITFKTNAYYKKATKKIKIKIK